MTEFYSALSVLIMDNENKSKSQNFYMSYSYNFCYIKKIRKFIYITQNNVDWRVDFLIS